MNFVFAALLSAVAAHGAEPSSIYPGTLLSMGPGYRVTARLTFDRRKAAAGGHIYAVARPSAADAEAIRLSEAVLTGSPGLLGPAAVMARRHRLPALALPQARWESGSLSLRRPIYGAQTREEGVSMRLVERFEELRLSEGDVVSVDPANGWIAVFEPGWQTLELDLAQALRGFDGLKDAQALIQWHDARLADVASQPQGTRAAMAARLIDELLARVAARTATPAQYQRVSAAAAKGLDGDSRRVVAEAARRAVARELRALARQLEEIGQGASDAGTAAALDGLESRARELALGAKALAAAAGETAQARDVEQAARAAGAKARARLSSVRGAAGAPEEALARAGAPLPETRDIPAPLYQRFLGQTGLAPLLAEISGDASLDLSRKSQRISALFAAARLEADSELGRLIARRLPAAPLLTISGPDGSMPRVPAARVLDAVKRAWAMSWEPGPLGRRKRAGLPAPAPALAAAAEVAAQASGLAYSRDPVTGARRVVVVHAVLGHAEGMESGFSAADQYTLDRRTLAEALAPLVADKREKLEPDAATGELKRVVVPPGPSLARALTPAQLERIGRAARALDDHLGHGVELRFAFAADGRLYTLGWSALR